jgi:hypothetical protein
VRPDRIEQFEDLAREMRPEQEKRPGCRAIRYVKRFYTFDRIGELPRPLTKIVKCVKYYSYWEFDSIEEYAEAVKWFFDVYEKRVMPLLIMPFDINSGEAIE